MRPRRLLLGCFVVSLVSPALATAQAPVPYESEHPVEFNWQPVLVPPVVLGRGGATIGWAQGASSLQFNPAAVANRTDTQTALFVPDANGAISFSLAPRQLIENIPGVTPENRDLRIARVSAMVGVADFGAGVIANYLQIDTGAGVRASAAVAGAGGGWFWRAQAVVVGARANFMYARLIGPGWERRYDGAGATFGVLWRPKLAPIRVGTAFRPAMRLSEYSARGAPPLLEPDQIVVPWRLGIGGAWQFGTPEDPPWRSPLLLLDVVGVGHTEQSVGIQSWLAQDSSSRGLGPSLEIHSGLESLIVPRRLRVRTGIYLEPARGQGFGRLHTTAGLDVRVWKSFRITGAVDVARAYNEASVSVGVWHN